MRQRGKSHGSYLSRPEMGLCIKLGSCVSALPGGARGGVVYKTRTGSERTHIKGLGRDPRGTSTAKGNGTN